MKDHFAYKMVTSDDESDEEEEESVEEEEPVFPQDFEETEQDDIATDGEDGFLEPAQLVAAEYVDPVKVKEPPPSDDEDKENLPGTSSSIKKTAAVSKKMAPVAATKKPILSAQLKAVPKEVRRPTTEMLVTTALQKLNDRKGVSLQAIKKFILSEWPAVEEVRLSFAIKRYMKKALQSGKIIQTRGMGLAGSFQLLQIEKEKKAKVASRPPQQNDGEKAAKHAVMQQKDKKMVKERKPKAKAGGQVPMKKTVKSVAAPSKAKEPPKAAHKVADDENSSFSEDDDVAPLREMAKNAAKSTAPRRLLGPILDAAKEVDVPPPKAAMKGTKVNAKKPSRKSLGMLPTPRVRPARKGVGDKESAITPDSSVAAKRKDEKKDTAAKRMATPPASKIKEKKASRAKAK